MEWWLVLTIIVVMLLCGLLSGLPVALAFLLVNLICVYLFMGGIGAVYLVAASAIDNIGQFALVAVPMFTFLGEIMWQTGVATRMISALGKWIGGVRGSLSLLAVAAGVLFAMMSGAAMASVAVLGSTLVADMRKRGYSLSMSIGPVLGAGGLAIIIPPSAMMIVMGSLARISIGQLLIAGILPGLMLASLYGLYIVIRVNLQPHLAPPFAPPRIPWGERMRALLIISPVSLIIFSVLGLIFLGVTTPSEAAATGTLAAMILGVIYGGMTWEALFRALEGTVKVTSMIMLIIMGSMTFSNVLSYTGTTKTLVELAANADVHPLFVVLLMQIVLIALGTVMDGISMLMITIPIYMPIVTTLGFNPVWFGILIMVNIEMSGVSPPFGLYNFVAKGIVPDASMMEIVKAGFPFFLLQFLGILLMMVFPAIVTWLPGLMKV
jgi:tripartite ATP-independent transporter DctM subunit